MLYEDCLKKYYEAIEQANYADIMKLFAKDSVVIHPIFGHLSAKEFFKLLLEKSKNNDVRMINIFKTDELPTRRACYLNVSFVTQDNQTFEEEAIHIFDFQTNGLISKVTVIIDTFPFRKEYS